MKLKKSAIPAGVLNILATLKTKGFAAYLVGGSVRDLLINRTPAEWDITTSAKPAEIMKLFIKVVPTGIDYGTVTIIAADGNYEVTTFRADEQYLDGRHPSNVRFTNDLHQDLSRRDFTINALAYEPFSNELVDDFAGQVDLKKHLIRAVGDPFDRFSEDGLRSIRACRFAAQLNFKLEEKTKAAIAQTLEVTRKVASERLHDELVKLLAADTPSIGLELMRETGLLAILLPELVTCFRVEQPPNFHKYDVYWHNLHACDAAPKDNLVLRLAALLHDIGKPACKVDLTFYNHDKTGAVAAEALLRRLKFGNNEIKQIVNLINNHMFNYTKEWTEAAVRRFLRRIGGVENVKPLFALRRADTAAMELEIGATYLFELQNRIDKIVAAEHALDISDLKVNGQDVMSELKIPPGPKVGQVLNALLEKVLDDPKLNDHQTLLNLIKTYA
jgi:poly(A) polymerase/tRNA nucleotidyltransferase (CCA-adding enzyme)